MVGGAVLPGCCVGAVLVPLIIITFCHLVSNNKMKRLHTFLPAEVGALCCLFRSSLGCSQAPLCVIAISFLPHFLHSHRCCITINHTYEQQWCWVLGSCSFVSGGRGLT